MSSVNHVLDGKEVMDKRDKKNKVYIYNNCSSGFGVVHFIIMKVSF